MNYEVLALVFGVVAVLALGAKYGYPYIKKVMYKKEVLKSLLAHLKNMAKEVANDRGDEIIDVVYGIFVGLLDYADYVVVNEGYITYNHVFDLAVEEIEKVGIELTESEKAFVGSACNFITTFLGQA